MIDERPEMKAEVGELWRFVCGRLEQKNYPIYPLRMDIGPLTYVQIGGSYRYNLGGGWVPPAISMFMLSARRGLHEGEMGWRVFTEGTGFDHPDLLKNWTDDEVWQVVEMLWESAEKFFATDIGQYDLIVRCPPGAALKEK